MKNRLDQDFTLGGLLRFALPTTIMMLVTSFYTIVDGVLTSRLVGENALAAINIAYPAISAMLAVGIMLGTGGSAVVGHRMGAGDMAGARRTFGFLALAAVCAGGLFALVGGLWPEELARLLGASDLLERDAAIYLRIQLLFAPMAMLQLLLESFFVTAGRPGLGLGLTIAAGITNGVLDWVYMGPLGLGIAGAAIATVTGFCIPAGCGALFFLLRRQGLRFAKPELRWRLLGRACFNGSSEMVTNLSTAVTTFCFNAIMLSLLGETGVAAITILLYAQFLLVSLFLGFSMGVAPVFSFNHGAERYDRLRSVFSHCARFILLGAAAIFALVHYTVSWPMVFLIGTMLAWIYWRTGSLAAPMVIHCTVNFFALLSLPLYALLAVNRTLGILAALGLFLAGIPVTCLSTKRFLQKHDALPA